MQDLVHHIRKRDMISIYYILLLCLLLLLLFIVITIIVIVTIYFLRDFLASVFFELHLHEVSENLHLVLLTYSLLISR